MMELTFYSLNRIPVKRRVRFTRSGHSYTDANTKADMLAVRDAYKGQCFTCPVALILYVGKQKAKSDKSQEPTPFTVKPDLDNVIKAVLDGLNGKAFFDDKQVTMIYAKKLDRTQAQGEFVRFAIVPASSVTGELVMG